MIKARTQLTARFRGKVPICFGLFAVITVLWLPRFSGPIDLRWDGGTYYILGTSLAQAKGYKLLHEPGEIDATQYPPLLPLIIAAHQWILGTSDPTTVGRWLRLSSFLLFNVYIFAIFSLTSTYLPPIYAFLATIICLLNFHLYFLSDLCFPEILFGLITILFVICNRNGCRKLFEISAPIFAIALYTLRTIGITMMAAWIAESIFKKEFKKASFRLIVSLIPIAYWQLYISSIESDQLYSSPVYEYQRADYLFYNVSYAKNISLKDPFTPEFGYSSSQDMAERFLANLAVLPSSLGEAVGVKKALLEMGWGWLNEKVPFMPVTQWPVYFALTILSGLILGGIGLQLVRRQWIIPFYLLTYLGSLCLTPWPGQFPRYLAPLAPFMALCLFLMLLAIKAKASKISATRLKLSCKVFIVSIVSLIIIQESVLLFFTYTRRHQKVIYEDQSGRRIAYRLFFYTDAYRALDAGLDWLKKEAKPTDVVASSMPQWVYLRTGLKAVMPPFEPNPIKAQYLIDSVPVSYLVLDEGLAVDTRKYTVPVVQNLPERWKLVYVDSIHSDSIIPGSAREPDGRFEIYRRLEPQIPSSDTQ